MKKPAILKINYRRIKLRKRIGVIILLSFLSPFVFGDLPVFNEANRNKSPDELWQLFLDYPNSESKAEILVVLAAREKGNRNITEKINNYLFELNNLFGSGNDTDYLLVSAVITAIVELNDTSSYPVLLSVLNTGYPEVISSEAYGALDIIDGNLYRFLSGVIEKNPPIEKYIALRAGINSERLSVSERGRLASLALEKALDADEETADYSALRYAAVLELSSLKWTNASALAVRNFYRVNEDFLQNDLAKNRLIEAITCLGAVGNMDAALVLALQLGFINAGTEKTGSFDPEITLAIIRALGNIGTGASFDHLIHVTHLSYPDYVKNAAREAVDHLKW
jgi:hypothetical protein